MLADTCPRDTCPKISMGADMLFAIKQTFIKGYIVRTTVRNSVRNCPDGHSSPIYRGVSGDCPRKRTKTASKSLLNRPSF